MKHLKGRLDGAWVVRLTSSLPESVLQGHARMKIIPSSPSAHNFPAREVGTSVKVSRRLALSLYVRTGFDISSNFPARNREISSRIRFLLQFTNKKLIHGKIQG